MVESKQISMSQHQIVRNIFIFLFLISFGFNLFFIANRKEVQPIDEARYNSEIEILRFRIKQYGIIERRYEEQVDSLSEAIKVKQKTRIIYINQHAEENEKINKLTGIAPRLNYLDSIFANHHRHD
jgi:hypothetical protein